MSHRGAIRSGLAGLLLLLVGVDLVAAPTHYTIERLGLTGAVYTRSDGYQYSNPVGMNAAGQVWGLSYRYSGMAYIGQDAWLHNGGSTVQLGYTGGAYEQTPGGRRETWVSGMNSQGMVTGYSFRYIAGNFGGSDAWRYSGGSTQQLGFTGAGYVQSNGYRYSETEAINDQGHVTGFSRRYSGTTALGEDAWLYDGSGTTQLGFTGASYAQTNGYRFSAAQFLNQSSQVAGYSARYNGTADHGRDAWLYSGGTTIQLGFTGAGYARTTGYRFSEVTALNDQAQALGFSKRYSGANGDLGQDVWRYSSGSTLQLGLTGAAYTQTGGYRYSDARRLNEQGQVAGYSRRFSGSTALGEDAWLYNGIGTVQIGLVGAGYEDSGGARSSSVRALNETGQVAGISRRYFFSQYADVAQDTWLYDGSTTRQIGLTGAGYEQAGGYRYSAVSALNDLGQVTGSSYRLSGSSDPLAMGSDAWFYDPGLDQVFSLNLSVRPSDNYAWSDVRYLGNDGVALGYYELYDQATSAELGRRAFYFSVADGLHDLGLLVDDLTADGWLQLAISIATDDAGRIIGQGSLQGMTGSAAYLLTPAPVPLPAALWLFGAGLGVLGFMRRPRVA